jgi:hypothetical protein
MTTDANTDKAPTTTTPAKPDNYDPVLGMISIDEPVLEWKFHFPISMLKLARILLAKEAERWNFTAAQVSRMMYRHRNKGIVTCRPMELREKLWNWPGEIRGGGYKVEWQEISEPRRKNDPPHFFISFSRVYRLEELLVKNEPL